MNLPKGTFEKCKGPAIDPCGTPQVRVAKKNKKSPMLTEKF